MGYVFNSAKRGFSIALLTRRAQAARGLSIAHFASRQQAARGFSIALFASWIDALDTVGGIPSVFRSRNPHMFCATVEAGLLDGHMKWIDVLNTVGGVLSVFWPWDAHMLCAALSVASNLPSTISENRDMLQGWPY